MLKIENFLERKEKIGVVGLGYVGLPLAVLLSRKYIVVGFDIKEKRVSELSNNYDSTKEISEEKLKDSHIEFTNEEHVLRMCRVKIITVPTPVNKHNIPDLTAIKSATEIVARNLNKGEIVIYESTVYPGLTEEECVPLLEKFSGLKWKKDFFVGYSPERVNPGDKAHTIDKINKIVSADTVEALEFIYALYKNVIEAQIHKAPDIKTAEAAKVIENTQRDLNIALMNELALIFNKMGINTKEVLKAASTKWNFLKFEPGLVGGHCIGVDPYYLTFKAKSIGYHPEIILAGRKINDYMGKYIAEVTVKNLIKAGKAVKGSKALILGFTFKENITDIRNTKVIDIYEELSSFGVYPYIFDPNADKKEVEKIYSIKLLNAMEQVKPYDAVILAVKHDIFVRNLSIEVLKRLFKGNPVLIDVKGLFSVEEAKRAGILYWSL